MTVGRESVFGCYLIGLCPTKHTHGLYVVHISEPYKSIASFSSYLSAPAPTPAILLEFLHTQIYQCQYVGYLLINSQNDYIRFCCQLLQIDHTDLVLE